MNITRVPLMIAISSGILFHLIVLGLAFFQFVSISMGSDEKWVAARSSAVLTSTIIGALGSVIAAFAIGAIYAFTY